MGIFPGLHSVSMTTGGCKVFLTCGGGVWGNPPVTLTSVLPQYHPPHPLKQRAG